MRERAWTSPESERELGEFARLSVAGWMALASPWSALSTDRDSAAVRVEGPSGPLLVKWRRPSARKSWKSVGRPSRERSEAHGLLCARACGLEAPQPLLVLERRGALGRLVGAVLVRPFVLGLETANVLLARSDGRRHLPTLARHARAWHDAGYRHGDCWPKNVLLAEDGSRAVPIGAPKAERVAPGPTLDRPRLRDLARLVAGAGLQWPGEDAFQLLDAYLASPGLPPRPVVQAAVAPLLARVLENRAEDERTRPTREPKGPPLPVPLPADARAPRRRSRPLSRLA